MLSSDGDNHSNRDSQLLWRDGYVEGAHMICQFRSITNKPKGIFLGDNPLEYATPTLLVQIFVIFLISQFVHFILRRLRQDILTAQVLAGIIIGPSLLSHQGSVFKHLFSPSGMLVLRTLGYFGFIIHTFGLGVNMNATAVRGIGRKAFSIGFACYTCAAGAGYAAHAIVAMGVVTDKYTQYGVPMFIMINSVSSFLVIMCHLMNLDILNSEIGFMAASTAVVTDISGWFLIAFMANVVVAGERFKGTMSALAVLDILLYYWVMFFVFRPYVMRIIKKTPIGKPLKESDFFTVILIVLGLAFWAEYIGQHAPFGVFLFGLCLPDGPPLGSTFMHKYETIASSLLLPVFYAANGMRANIYSLNWKTSPAFELVIIMGYVGKFTGSLLSALLFGVPLKDATLVSMILCTKGIMEVAAYGLCMDSLVFSVEFFTLALLTMIGVNSFILPTVKSLYDPSTRYTSDKVRSILHSADQRGVLRMMVCIHREENLQAMIKLLQASYPSRERPVTVFVLQLSQLVGYRKATIEPHQLQKKPVKPGLTRTKSERIINAFTIFEKLYQNDVKVQQFTAVAPYATMHNDICTVAHDKGVSIIILPFHKNWMVGGAVDDSYNCTRRVNKTVLKKAPCSVGILIDRNTLTDSNTVILQVKDQCFRSIAMMFIGGVDDHEALVFARRMADNPDTRLLVIWVKSDLEGDENPLDRMLIKEFLTSIENCPNMTYKENAVEDGTGTIKLARALDEHADLVMVGRHHHHDSTPILGLTEWSDCPELGAVGDMLATWDFKFSVLVVQHQLQIDDDPFYLKQSSMRSLDSKASVDQYSEPDHHHYPPTTTSSSTSTTKGNISRTHSSALDLM